MKFKISYNSLTTYLNNKKRKKLLEILNNQLGGSTNSFDSDSDNEETKENSLKLDIKAPLKDVPSMTRAIELYIKQANNIK